MNIAIVCDWLTNMGGAEKVILALHQMFPQAPIYTSVYNAERMEGFENARIYTSKLQKYPFAKKKHQIYLPWMPKVFEEFDLSAYDLVISSSHSCAKGIITKPKTLHICYCHTPMRYAWENSHKFIQEYHANKLMKFMAPILMHKIRLWDRLSAERVDEFIANSKYVAKRIEKYYRKPARVIYPFVDAKKFQISASKKNYFLAFGRLTSYKKFDLIVEVFNALGLPLKIVGTGVAYDSLKRMSGPNIEFLGHVTDSELENLFAHAQALIFPQIEDFGIIPLEAMAAGCPVIAYAGGGALETVIDKKTGLFFKEQNAASLKGAVEKFQTLQFNSKEIREHALTFDRKVFQEKMLQFIEEKWEKWSLEMV